MLTIGALLQTYWGLGGEYPRTDRLDDVLELISGLEPIELMQRDGWGTPLRYRVADDGLYYELSSAGADGVFEDLFFGRPAPEESLPRVARLDFSRDIVIHAYALLQFPMYYAPGESGCEDERAKR